MTVGCHVSVNGATLPLRNNKVQSSEKQHGEICWPDPRVRCLSRGGPGGHCRYPEDRVPPYTNSKSRQRTRRGLTHAHVFCGSSSYLLAQGSSGTATCPMALAPASWPRAALQPPRVPWLQLWPPGSGQLWDRHMSHGSSSRFLAQGSFAATTCPVAPALASWLKAAPETSCVPWSSTGYGLLM
jgi:hypothetical protein